MRVALLTLALAVPAAADTRYVDDDAPLGGDGMSWETAYRFLQDALDAALIDDISEIRIGGGTQRTDRSEAWPAGSGDQLVAFELVDGVEVRGGYAGSGAVDPDARDVVAYETILSGDLAGDDAPGFGNTDENAFTVVVTSAVGPGTVIDGVTISGGNARGSGADRHASGGGVWNDGGSPTLVGCTIRSNQALDAGGGMDSAGGGWPSLIDCSIVDNHAEFIGGGLSLRDLLADVRDCDIGANVAPYGGGMWCEGYPLIQDCIIRENVGTARGGGCLASGGGPTFIGVTFRDNDGTERGGGLYAFTSDVEINACTFDSNVADSGGGLFAVTNSSPNAHVASTFVGNVATLGGGAYVEGSHWFDRCVFDANTGDDGGGAATLGNTTFNACTFTANGATRGGGSFAWYATSMYFDCVVTDNDAETGAGIYVAPLATVVEAGGRFEANVASLSGGAVHAVGPLVTESSEMIGNAAPLGGAVYASEGLQLLSDLRLEGNDAIQGGAVYADAADVVLDGCEIVDNAAAFDGGGVYQFGLAVVATSSSTFEGNRAGFDGGGLYLASGSGSTIDGTTFVSNEAERGGGVMSLMGDPLLTGCIFRANDAARGGAVSLQSGSASLRECVLDGNTAEDGGGLAIADGAPTISKCSFVDNSGETGGGAFVDGGAPLFTDSTFAGNAAENGGGGGGIASEAESVTCADCLFVGNTAPDSGGGGVRSEDTSFVATACRFDGNTATSGGGLGLHGETALVDACVFEGNDALFGGGLQQRANDVRIVDGLFHSNSAGIRGAAIDFFGASDSEAFALEVSRCILAGNLGSDAVDAWDGSLVLESSLVVANQFAAVETRADANVLSNCTVVANGSRSGAVRVTAGAPVEFVGCVLWGNAGAPLNVLNGSATVSWTNIEGGWEGIGVIDVDPLFVDADGLDDDALTWLDNDYRLAPGSPCIDAGDNVMIPAWATLDVGGRPRFVDDPAAPDVGNPDGINPLVDMGAYERQVECPADLDLDGFVGAGDLVVLLGAWGTAGPGADLAHPIDVVDAGDLVALVAVWGGCE